MAIDPELEEILLQWEEQGRCDKPLSLEELCRGHEKWIVDAQRLIGRVSMAGVAEASTTGHFLNSPRITATSRAW